MVTGHRVFEKWLALSLVFVLLTLAATFPQNNNYKVLHEGSSCILKNNEPGTCRLLQDCPSQLSLLKTRPNFRPQICSFQGSNAVICCQNSKPTTSLPVISSSTASTNGGVVNRILAGEKSKKACSKYSKEIPRQVVTFIHEGVTASEGEFPHMALLGYIAQGQSELTWNCGGALISDRFVVTAAHCFADRLLRAPVRVRLGEYDIGNNNDHAEDYVIEKYFLHPEYTSRSWYHDLALIKLNRKVKFTNYIQPACLWVKPEDPQKGLIITGWGGIDPKSSARSNVLLKGNRTLNRVPPEVCSTSYKLAGNLLRDGIKPGMQLCAVDPVGTVDTCKGDSGGPIQVNTGQLPGVSFFVLGVTSGGPSLCGGRTPTIYTRLYNYLDWIETNVWP